MPCSFCTCVMKGLCMEKVKIQAKYVCELYLAFGMHCYHSMLLRCIIVWTGQRTKDALAWIVTQQWPYSNESSFLFSELMENRTKLVSTWEHDSFHLSIWNQAKKNLSSISSFVSQKWSMVIKLWNFSPLKKSESFILTRVTVIHPNICQYFFSTRFDIQK